MSLSVFSISFVSENPADYFLIRYKVTIIIPGVVSAHDQRIGRDSADAMYNKITRAMAVVLEND